jgi:nicotinate-nucleotide adenylyltransferase
MRVAFYGGSFDPPHRGHLEIAAVLCEQFLLDRFVYIPAFHAPHKVRLKPTSAYDRYAMLCLATDPDRKLFVSRIEIEAPERPYSIETLTTLTTEMPNDEIFFVMGADSWMDIRTWREWERVLTITNHIVVTRPGYEIATDHVTDEIRRRIVDLRGGNNENFSPELRGILITDAVNLDISATKIRAAIRGSQDGWRASVTDEVANYIEKYQIYT